MTRVACLLLAACGTGIIVRMETGGLPPRWGTYARRLPSSLEDLRGPATGEVELPLPWPGQDDGYTQRGILERFVHRESLVSMWPRLRRLLGPHARREWERRLITPTPR